MIGGHVAPALLLPNAGAASPFRGQFARQLDGTWTEFGRFGGLCRFCRVFLAGAEGLEPPPPGSTGRDTSRQIQTKAPENGAFSFLRLDTSRHVATRLDKPELDGNWTGPAA